MLSSDTVRKGTELQIRLEIIRIQGYMFVSKIGYFGGYGQQGKKLAAVGKNEKRKGEGERENKEKNPRWERKIYFPDGKSLILFLNI